MSDDTTAADAHAGDDAPPLSGDGAGTRTAVSEPPPALVREWAVCALVAAAARFVPLPVLDDAVADQAQRESVRRALRAQGRRYPVSAVDPLIEEEGWSIRSTLARIPRAIVLFPVRKWVKIVGAARGVPADLTRVLVLSRAVYRATAQGRLTDGTPPEDLRREAEEVRRAFDAVLREMDLRLLWGALADALSGVRGLSKALVAYAGDRFRRDRDADRIDPGGEVGQGAETVEATLRRPEVVRLLAEFDRRFDARLGQVAGG